MKRVFAQHPLSMTCLVREGNKKMPCYFPKSVLFSEFTQSFIFPKRGQTFEMLRCDYINGLNGGWVRPMLLPCNDCFGCRRKKAVQYGARAVHETQINNVPACFITLTYRDAPYSLEHKHYQNFMKRFRERVPDLRLRQLMCGEYGDKYGRAHFHALIWGTDFMNDRRRFKQMSGYWLYNSSLLDDLWGHGYCTISDVTFESAAYVGGYCFKKINGTRAPDRQYYVDPFTGECRRKEYIIPSRNPALGIGWLQKYYQQVFERDERLVFEDGRSVPIPARYKKWCAEHHPKLYADWKSRMVKKIEEQQFDVISDLEGSDPARYAEEYNLIVAGIQSEYVQNIRRDASEVAKAKFKRNQAF